MFTLGMPKAGSKIPLPRAVRQSVSLLDTKTCNVVIIMQSLKQCSTGPAVIA